MPQIFTDPSALEDSPKDVNNLTEMQQAEVVRIKRKLDTWLHDKSRIVAYSGHYGTGKSTILNKVHENYLHERAQEISRWKQTGEIPVYPLPLWLDFEAWRYSSLGQLWDGFAIEIIDKIHERTNHTKTSQLIDGIRGLYGSVYRHPIVSSLISAMVYIALSSLLWIWLHDKTTYLLLLIKDLLKYAVPALFAVLAFFGISSLLQKREPLKRTFDIERELAKNLNKSQQPLIVIAEDVDRSTGGLAFLESLRHFLNSVRLEYPVIIIAPQSGSDFNVLNSSSTQGVQHAIKVYDNVMYYTAASLTDEVAINLIEEAGVIDSQRLQLKKMIEEVLRRYRTHFSIRFMKSILRELNDFAESQEEIDAGVAFLLIASRYIETAVSKNPARLIDIFIDGRLTGDDTTAAALIDLGKRQLFNILKSYSSIDSELNEMKICYDNTSEEIDVEEMPMEARKHNSHILITLHQRYQTLLS